MSVIIIKTGCLPADVLFVGKCKNCGTEVRASYEDHNAEWTPSRRGRFSIVVDCPLDKCGHKINCKKEKKE